MPKPCVLVVDDDLAILEVMRIVLEDEGYGVATDTGGSVMETMRVASPDLILLDVWMPGVDGRMIARQLKDAFPSSCVVLMSAHSDAIHAVAETGADGFLEKPFELEELVAVVRQYVGG